MTSHVRSDVNEADRGFPQMSVYPLRSSESGRASRRMSAFAWSEKGTRRGDGGHLLRCSASRLGWLRATVGGRPPWWCSRPGSGFAVAYNRPGRIDVLVVILSAALLLGLVGFALTIGWVAAVVVSRLGWVSLSPGVDAVVSSSEIGVRKIGCAVRCLRRDPEIDELRWVERDALEERRRDRSQS